jgi:Peptidase family C25/FG-GAP-like repeat/Propeptide_C25
MKRLCMAVGYSAALLMAVQIPALAATVEHTFTFEPSRLQILQQDGVTEVRADRASREFRAGLPDLPWITEDIDVPAGMRVSRIEVVSLDTTPLRSGVTLRSAIVPKPGLGPIERSPVDAALYARGAFLPEVPVELGAQGFMRDRNLATLRIAPARWNPASGALEAVRQVTVRLVLEPSQERPLTRERRVEWSHPERLSRAAERAARAATAPRPAVQPFVPTQIPSLLGSPVAYVIVTSEEMAPEFQRLADWKTQTGVPAVVRTMTFIRQEYPYGADDAERIRLFIRDAYTRWGTEWVLLGGDTEIVPTRYIRTSFFGGEDIATDLYFSSLDGNWDADADSLFGEGYFSPSDPGDDADLYPEVYVGRAPTVTLADAKHFVDRSINYVKSPAPDYQTQVLFFAEVLFPQNWNPSLITSLDGAELVEEVLPSLRTNPSIHYQRLYENYLDPRWEPGALHETRQLVADSLSRGYNVAVHVGHGFRNVMSCGDANFTNGDALGLMNGSKVTNLYAINCTSNAIDFPCIGEAFLKAENGGAVTNIGSTRFDFPTAGRMYQKEYFRLLYEDSVTAIGELQARQKVPFIGFSSYDGVHRWTQMTLLLLGDPELRVYTGLPRTLTVVHPTSFPVTETGFLVNVKIGGVPVEGAVVTAYRPGDEYASVVTDAAGDASVPFRADSTGSFTLTVTAYDCKPYQATIGLDPVGTPVIAQQTPVVDDDLVGGTQGNGDGVFDTGETVDLMIPLKNTGGGTATSVVATLSTSDPNVTVLNGLVVYGGIGVGATATPSVGFRVSTPVDVPDQHEVAFQLDISDGVGGNHVEKFQMVLHAPEPFHLSHVVDDSGGNANGHPDAGETVGYTVTLRNLGTGRATGLTAVLRNYDGLATITDSTASFGNLNSGVEGAGDPFTFLVSSSSAKLELRVSDQDGLRTVEPLDLGYPSTPIGLAGAGAGTSIALTWTRVLEPDLRGYNIYRSTNPGGPYTRANPVPTFRIAYYMDENLAPLTRYYYRVTAVDSSANESAKSAEASLSTNPPSHTIFPVETNWNTPSSVAFDHAYPGYPVAIAVGSKYLHVFHPDGSYPVDADGSGTTFGDFTTLGSSYTAGPAIADLDGGGVEFIGGAWDPAAITSPVLANRLFVFDTAGQPKAGWPVQTSYSIWSSPAIGDLNNDGQMEIAVGTNGNQFLVYRANGTEWMDGDSNPSTTGVFKLMGASTYNSGTAAIVDLDGNGIKDIVFGSADGNLYAWRPDGSNLPGFPINTGSVINSSVAVGYLDGPTDTQLDIVCPVTDNTLRVYTATGALRAGFPVPFTITGTSRAPSPALADMNNDGYLDIVMASTNGKMYVYDRNGAILAPFNAVPYSTLTSAASESSPVVADINGDGLDDVIMGDEFNQLNALSGATGTPLPGFPIELDAEVKATPGVCDCDGDGKTELIAMTWGGKLFMWDYDFPFSPNGTPPWPQFHHDARHTGYSGSQALVGVDPPGDPGIPARLELAQAGPNPARFATRVEYAIPAEFAGQPFQVDVFDLNGRRIQTLVRGQARAGRHFTQWDLRDGQQRGVDAGVYFVRFSIGTTHLSRKLVVMR